jgi:hypothetical protein
MELAKHTKYFEFDVMDTGAGDALKNLVKVMSPQFKAKMEKSKESSPDIDPSESSGDSEEPEEIVEDFKDNEETRDDEDFIVIGSPKPKKKGEKRITKSSSAKSSSRKRKCEFCGTMETPMWRRGPTGKGTLCNACGVKWSLKFRKRTGKKAKVEKHKDDARPREQRQSTRKKIPSTKVAGTESKEENSPQDFCCSHLLRKRQSSEDVSDELEDSPVLKKKKDSSGGSGEEDSLSEGEDSDLRLLGRLLNVVEYQLVEERQIDLVKKQLSELRSELHSKEKLRQMELDQSSSDALDELTRFRLEWMTFNSHSVENSQEKLLETTAQTLTEFTKTIRNQMEEIRNVLGNAGSNGLGKKFDNLQSELSKLHTRMDANFSALRAKVASDANVLEKILVSKEDDLRNSLASRKKSAEQEFEDMSQRLDRMEETL